MRIDNATVFLVLLLLTTLIGLLMRWAAWAHEMAPALKRWGSAYLVAALGMALFFGRGRWPDFLTINLANAATLGGYSLMWSSARLFNGRTPALRFCVLPVLLWLGPCALPAIAGAEIARVELFSALCAGLSLMIGREFLGGSDPLLPRLSGFGLPTANGIFFLLRAAFIATADSPARAWREVWFPLTAIEAILFAVAMAFLLLSLALARLTREQRTHSEHDYLTGAVNRRGFFVRGTALFERTRRAGHASAVLVFDLDRFKQINDTLGHPTGDRVLEAFGAAARQELRKTDLLCRLGGDEFVALLPDVDEARATEIGDRIATRFAETCEALEGVAALGGAVSVGVAGSPRSEGQLGDLIQQADAALYRQKQRRHNALPRGGAPGGLLRTA